MYATGQVVIGRLPFKDGTLPSYRRPYLVVSVDEAAKEIKVLVISSVLGKEHKLNFHANILLENAIPPLSQPSFVKADSAQIIGFETARLYFKPLMNGHVSAGDMLNIANALALIEMKG